MLLSCNINIKRHAVAFGIPEKTIALHNPKYDVDLDNADEEPEFMMWVPREGPGSDITLGALNWIKRKALAILQYVSAESLQAPGAGFPGAKGDAPYWHYVAGGKIDTKYSVVNKGKFRNGAIVLEKVVVSAKLQFGRRIALRDDTDGQSKNIRLLLNRIDMVDPLVGLTQAKLTMAVAFGSPLFDEDYDADEDADNSADETYLPLTMAWIEELKDNTVILDGKALSDDEHMKIAFREDDGESRAAFINSFRSVTQAFLSNLVGTRLRAKGARGKKRSLESDDDFLAYLGVSTGGGGSGGGGAAKE